jgi:hypothetical protein
VTLLWWVGVCVGVARAGRIGFLHFPGQALIVGACLLRCRCVGVVAVRALTAGNPSLAATAQQTPL